MAAQLALCCNPTRSSPPERILAVEARLCISVIALAGFPYACIQSFFYSQQHPTKSNTSQVHHNEHNRPRLTRPAHVEHGKSVILSSSRASCVRTAQGSREGRRVLWIRL